MRKLNNACKNVDLCLSENQKMLVKSKIWVCQNDTVLYGSKFSLPKWIVFVKNKSSCQKKALMFIEIRFIYLNWGRGYEMKI